MHPAAIFNSFSLCLHLFWRGNVIWHSLLSFLKLQLPFAPARRWTFSFSYPFILFPFTGFLTLPTARWSPIMPTLLSSSAILSNLNVLSSLSFCIALTSPWKAPKSPSLHFYTPAPDAQFLFYVIRPYMYRDVISNSTYPEPDTSSFWDESVLSTVPSTWQVLKGKLLFPVLHLPHWGSLPKTVLMMPFCFFTFYGLPLPNKTWGNPYIQDLTFKTKMTPHHSPAHAPNFICAGHLPISHCSALDYRKWHFPDAKWLCSETLT